MTETMLEAEEKMEKAVEVAKEHLAGIRTGRVNPGLFSKVTVDYYGAPTPLQQLASFTTTDARTLLITPFDQSALRNIEKALSESEVGANPSNDGKVIRIVMPELTEERRKEIAKQVKTKGEDHKIAIRNIRRDSNELLKTQLKDKKITEDDSKRLTDQVQKVTDDGVKKVDEIVSAKEKEVMAI